MRRPVLVALLVAAALTASLLPPRLGTSTPATAADPSLRVTTVASGLALPWDAQPLPDGRLLVTERSTKRLLLVDGGVVQPVSYASSTVWASGETGLMSLAVDPDFSSNRRFYTCQGGYLGSGHDVKVMAWRLSGDGRSAASAGTLLQGIPATSGRHGGCRLQFTYYDALLVGTGDAAIGRNPRAITSLGGKVLRLDRLTGKPWPQNPHIGNRDSVRARYVLTYGHRNVQGLAERSDHTLWSVEHGPTRDDEVNRLVRNGDYGWQPTPGYDESKPMTDQALAGTQQAARWSSGSPTLATSGAAWVSGSRWGSYNGTLAVAALKGERVLFMAFDSSGKLTRVATPAALRSYGRLRSVTSLPGGDLLITTANGSNDRVLRVSPA